MFMTILGFFIRMCIYIVFALEFFILFGLFIAILQHYKKVEKIEQDRRELFGDD